MVEQNRDRNQAGGDSPDYQSSYISGWGPAHTRLKNAEIVKCQLINIPIYDIYNIIIIIIIYYTCTYVYIIYVCSVFIVYVKTYARKE